MNLPIYFLHGDIAALDQTQQTAIVNINGLGLLIYVLERDLTSLIASSEYKYKFFTSTQYGQEEMKIYAFLLHDDLFLFNLLSSVKGVGGKTCMALMNKYNSTQILECLNDENIKLLSEVPGLGKKTAERLIFELKPKFKKLQKNKPELFEQAGIESQVQDQHKQEV